MTPARLPLTAAMESRDAVRAQTRLRHVLGWSENDGVLGASSQGVIPTERGRYDHEVLSRALQVLLAQDRFNLTNLQRAELQDQRLQLLESVARVSSFLGWRQLLSGRQC